MSTSNPDLIVVKSLKVVHNHGAKLYNVGRHLETVRLYQGALYVVLQLMTHRPDLRLIIADGMSEVEKSVADDQLKAFRLHEVIDLVRDILRDTSPTLSGLQAVKMEKAGNL